MQFSSKIVALALAAVASAQVQDADPNDGVQVTGSAGGQVDWISQDAINRVIHCTPSPGHVALPDISLPAGQTVTQSHPQGWKGMCWGVMEGGFNKGFGMLAEFTWNGFEDKTYFDVSAIDDPNDLDNIKMMMPAQGSTPVSGCQNIAVGTCKNMYVEPEDTQTQVTPEKHLLVLVGNLNGGAPASRIKRRGPFKRSYAVEGHE